MTKTHTRQSFRAFTLVELLVVIGIIALLISLVLRALGKARAAANTAACLANLRSLGQAMQTYVQSQNGWLPGAGVASRHLLNTSASSWTVNMATVSPNLPPQGPMAVLDWCWGLGWTMKLAFPTSGQAKDRYDFYRNVKVFQCPANDVVSTSFLTSADADAGVGPQIGYATAMGFLLTPATPTPGLTSHTRMSSGAGWWILPAGYVPRINKVGNAAEKIFMADAGKFSNGATAPTYNLQVAPNPNSPGRNSGPFTDFGPWTTATAAYDRLVANGSPGIDGRVFTYRHGNRSAGGRLGSYKLNAVFFDGHAETLDEAASFNPALWLPKRTSLDPTASFSGGPNTWADVRARWMPGNGASNPFIAP